MAANINLNLLIPEEVKKTAIAATTGALCGYVFSIVHPIGGAIGFAAFKLTPDLIANKKKFSPMVYFSISPITYLVTMVAIPLIVAYGITFLAGFSLSLTKCVELILVSILPSLLLEGIIDSFCFPK